MSNEQWPSFGHAPVCPKGFSPDYKLESANEEKRHYRKLWLAERERTDALAAHLGRIQSQGFCLVPQAITAETGHKAGMMGDFTETIALDCVHCDGEGCDECHDTGQHLQHITVSWTTIKAIHQRIVEIAEGHQ